MVGTVLPVVYGERARRRFTVAHWMHAAGAVIGGMLTGVLFGLGGLVAAHGIGRPPLAIAILVSGSLAGAYALREFNLVNVPMPQFRRQVPAAWRFQLSSRVMAFMYGIGLGAGVATFVRVATLYVVLVWIFFQGDPVLGALLMSTFGAARALPVVWIGRRTNSILESYAAVTLLENGELIVHLVNGALLVSAAGFLLATVSRGGG